jgi:hypothetical protein
VIPIVGTIVGKGIGFVTGVLAFALTAVTIALAWLFYRPLLGITLLVVAGASIFMLRRDRSMAPAAMPAVPPPAPAMPPPPPMVAPPPPPPRGTSS